MAKTQSLWPTSIDTTLQTDRVSGDTITSDSYDIIEDAIFELETKVGVDGSAVATSLDYKTAWIKGTVGASATTLSGTTVVTPTVSATNVKATTITATTVSGDILSAGAMYVDNTGMYIYNQDPIHFANGQEILDNSGGGLRVQSLYELGLQAGADGNGSVIIYTGSNTPATNERMRIDKGGNVCVVALLSAANVWGTTAVSGVTVSGTNIKSVTVTATTVSGATLSGTDVKATTVTATMVTAATVSATDIKATTVTGTTFSGTDVKATTITGTVVWGSTTISAATVSATTYTNLPTTIASAGCATNSKLLYGLSASELTATGVSEPFTAVIISATTFSGTNAYTTTVTATNLTAVNISATTYVNLPAGGQGDIKADGTVAFTAPETGTVFWGSAGISAVTVSGTTVVTPTISATNVEATTVTGTTLSATTFSGSKPMVCWSIPGTLSASTTIPATPPFVMPFGSTIICAYCRVTTSANGGGIIIDIHKNGTTIWATQTQRLCASTNTISGTQTVFGTTALAEGDYLDIYIDQVGTTAAGANLFTGLVTRT